MGALIMVPLKFGKLDLKAPVATFISTVVSGGIYTVCLFLFAGADASAMVAYVPIVLCTAVINTVIVQALYLPLRKVLKKDVAAPAGRSRLVAPFAVRGKRPARVPFGACSVR